MASVIVIGGGPAGMMAAIRSSQLGHKVLLLEKNTSLGKKLLLTGKGRCNLTNAVPFDEFILRFSKKSQFLRDAFKNFFVEDLFDFFQERGLKLKIERQKRVFPCTDSALSVLHVLKKELSSLGVEVLYNTTVKDIIIRDRKISGVRLWSSKEMPAAKIIIATGGVSYSFTGSTGDGHKIAEKAGHTISPLRPALVPLRLRQDYVKGLEGLSLKSIQIRFIGNKKILKSGIGELLFTDNGVSGPLVLSMSADVLDILKENSILKLEIDLKPALDLKQIDMRLLREINSSPRKTIFNLLRVVLPVRIIGLFLQLANINKDAKATHITGVQRKKITSLLKSWQLDVIGSAGFDKAMVTRGGVSLKDIDPKTMQSRHIKGLYFAGEIIDVDADTGGFNLQAAFSTGYLSGSLYDN